MRLGLCLGEEIGFKIKVFVLQVPGTKVKNKVKKEKNEHFKYSCNLSVLIYMSCTCTPDLSHKINLPVFMDNTNFFGSLLFFPFFHRHQTDINTWAQPGYFGMFRGTIGRLI